MSLRRSSLHVRIAELINQLAGGVESTHARSTVAQNLAPTVLGSGGTRGRTRRAVRRTPNVSDRRQRGRGGLTVVRTQSGTGPQAGAGSSTWPADSGKKD